jgi:hypothetical protein
LDKVIEIPNGAKLLPAKHSKCKPHILLKGEELKHCGHCDSWKSLVNFQKDHNLWDGLKSVCTSCKTIAQREYMHKSDKAKAYYSKYNKKYQEKRLDSLHLYQWLNNQKYIEYKPCFIENSVLCSFVSCYPNSPNLRDCKHRGVHYCVHYGNDNFILDTKAVLDFLTGLWTAFKGEEV